MQKPVQGSAAKQAYFDVNCNEHFELTIIHEEISDIAVNLNKKTWRVKLRPFQWRIDRPQTGTENYTRICPYCGKELQLTHVYSMENVLSQRKSIRIILFIDLGVIAASIVGIVLLSIYNPEQGGVYGFICIAAAIITLISLLTNLMHRAQSKSPDFECGTPKGELKSGHITAPYDQHYIKDIKGW